MSTLEEFYSVMRRLVGADGAVSLNGMDAAALAVTAGHDPAAQLARVNGSFLLSLCGTRDAAAATASLEAEAEAADGGSEVARFLLRLADRVRAEQRQLAERHPEVAGKRDQAAVRAQRPADESWGAAVQRALWDFLFPQGAACLEDPDQVVADLRARRTVRVDQLNPTPLADPISELLVTANVLLSRPSDPTAIDDLPLSRALRSRLSAFASAEQRYWYDHPIPIGVETEANEIIYGLRGLNAAVAFQKQRDNAAGNARLVCSLPVSVTHTGLETAALDYLHETLAAAPELPHLDVYVFSEATVKGLLDEVLPRSSTAISVAAASNCYVGLRRPGRIWSALQLPEGDLRALAGIAGSARPRHVQDRSGSGVFSGGAGGRERRERFRALSVAVVGCSRHRCGR